MVVEPEGAGNEATTQLIHKQPVVEDDVRTSDEGEADKLAKSHLQRRGTDVGVDSAQVVQPRINRISSVGVRERGAQVVAGWPSWLTAVAGEAINGWVPRKADSFEKLDKVS